MNKENINGIVQMEAAAEYEKAAKGPLKKYPSLELVRLEKLFFNSNNKGKLLEYAFGGGCNTLHLLECGYDVYGIDVAKGALNSTKKRMNDYPELQKKLTLDLLPLNATKIPYHDNYFAYGVALSILSLLGTESRVRMLLSELKRVMNENQIDRNFPIGGPILEVNNISLSFGGVKAITDTSFDVLTHEIRAIIGPNGAGKSSMLNCINGIYKPQEGSVVYHGETLSKITPNIAAQKGISRTFQNLALFKRMSALDNILVGRKLHSKANFIDIAFQLPKAKREETENRQKCEEIISFLEIDEIKNTPVGKLPYGLQKRVELGRALAAEPEVLLLDEPMAGMNVEEKREMCRFILEVNDNYGTTIVLIEHDMGVVMDISDRVVVLDYGKIIGDGTPDEVRSNQTVIDAYLGVAHG